MSDFFSSLSIADFIVIGIFLIFIIIGAIRGFMKSIGGIFVTVCSVVVATVFSGPLATFLKANTGLFTGLASRFAFGTNIDLATGGANVMSMSSETISAEISKAGFPKIFGNNVLHNISVQQYPTVTTLGGYVDYSLADIILTVICFVGLLIIAAIVASLIKMLLVKIARSDVLKYVDMFLGIGFGCVIALIVVYVICMILPTISLLINNPDFTAFVNGLSTAPIASVFYNDNILARWIGSIIKI